MTSESTTQRDRFRRRGAAFTLVELLAVVGIIALLLAILLPTLRRAREAAKAVQCLSNVRQLSGAVIMWAQEHQGYTPSGADWTPRRYDPVTRKFSTIGPPDTNPQFKEPSDWIAWMRALDPYTLRPNSVPSQNVTYSALTRYLGFRRKDHATDAEANRINPILDAVFRCPSDNLAQRNSGADDSHSIYRYSYSLNANYTNPTPARGRAVVDGRFSGRISSIRNASEKVMFICEDEKTLNHGTFQASADRFLTGGFTHLVASRHESKIRKATNINDSRREGNENARGNVGFCDGHAEFFSRKDALCAKHSGNAVPDPAGF